MEITAFAKPFPFWIINNCVPTDLAGAAAATVLPADHRAWVRYDNDCERRKWTCNELLALGNAWERLVQWLTDSDRLQWLTELTGVHGLVNDLAMHGAGCHLSFPGAVLAPHVDYAVHPKCGLERRVNLVLYLNLSWNPDWGGATEMCDPMGNAVERVYPAFNRAVIWTAGDESIHAMEPMTETANPRLTATVYYLTQPRPTAVRKRAMFLPRRS